MTGGLSRYRFDQVLKRVGRAAPRPVLPRLRGGRGWGGDHRAEGRVVELQRNIRDFRLQGLLMIVNSC